MILKINADDKNVEYRNHEKNKDKRILWQWFEFDYSIQRPVT